MLIERTIRNTLIHCVDAVLKQVVRIFTTGLRRDNRYFLKDVMCFHSGRDTVGFIPSMKYMCLHLLS
jgi:hypothetical protein